MVDYGVSIPGEVKDVIHENFICFPDCRIHSLRNFQSCYMQCGKMGYRAGCLKLRQHDDGYRGLNEYIKKTEVLLGRENDQVLFCNAIFL